ncbi:MAG: trypsin-like peptidase domain-containing protein [Pseudomonadota bacterium]
MLRHLGVIAFCLFPTIGTAQGLPTIEPPEGELRALATTDQIRPFAAVGRLDTGTGFCTATLITSELVLTAAHCLFDGSHDARRPDSSLIFNAGLRNGRVSAQRGVRASFVHPGYLYGAPDHLERVRTDLAVLRLDRPITDASVTPLPAHGRAGRGDEVQVVSYGEERENVASLEEGCEVLAADEGVFVLSCSVVHGSSGAPVMVRSGNGYQVVSVVSAAAHWRDDPVALSAELEGSISHLLSMAGAREPGFASAGLPQVRNLGAQSDGRSTSGARFIQP